MQIFGAGASDCEELVSFFYEQIQVSNGRRLVSFGSRFWRAKEELRRTTLRCLLRRLGGSMAT